MSAWGGTARRAPHGTCYEPVWEIEAEDSSLGEDVIDALDVDARATRPDGQDRPEDEALSV